MISVEQAFPPPAILPVPEINENKNLCVYQGLDIFYAVERHVAGFIRLIMVVSMLGLGLLMAMQVFMRYILQSPFLGIEELAPMFALWAYFAGMVYSTRDRDHIKGGILTLVVSGPRAILFVRWFGTIVCLATASIFLYFSWNFFEFNYALGRKSAYLGWPRSIWNLSMVFGFTGILLYLFLQFYLETRALLRGYGAGQ